MQRGHDASHGFIDIAPHQLRRKPQHAKPKPTQHAVPALIRSAPPFMRPIIHFNCKAGRGSEEIQDVPISGHLTTEGNAKLLAANVAPEDLLTFREVVPEKVRTLRQQRLELELLT